ncbi:MAG: RNA polymerase sigma factor [Nannocystaceae bacterium]|nr:RNA polymerase sigma factor [Nannocystaceae bacterium]
MTAEDVLFSKWRQGDSAAGAQLLGRLRPQLRSYFARRLPDQADDLTHEVLIACIEGRERFRGEAPYAAYVFTIARRYLVREIYVQARQRPIDEHSPLFVEHRLGERGLAEAMAALSPSYRQAVRLYFFDGASGPEIARTLCLSEGTIRSRVRRALGELRRHMGVSQQLR